MPRHISLVLLCGFWAVAACATTEPLPKGNAAFEVDRGIEYLLGPGDKVRIVVFSDQSLSGEFSIGNNGSVAVPLVGEVAAGGLNPSAFQNVLQERLVKLGMVRDPKVTVDVIEYRPYYIFGEVRQPGKYTYAIGMTVTKAVATAGGFTYRANDKVAFVTREGKTNEAPVKITAATWIGPGDTVRIGERNF